MIPEKPKLEVICRQSDTVKKLKDQIKKEHGLLANTYKLFFEGHELSCMNEKLKRYGMVNGSIINLIHWNVPAIGTRALFQLQTDSY